MAYKKISLRYFSAFFLICFSGYYVTKLSFSPVYVLSGFGFLISLVVLVLNGRFSLDRVTMASVILVVYFICSQGIFLSPKLGVLLNVVFSISTFTFLSLMLQRINEEHIFKLGRSFVLISLPLLIFESYYRIANPDYQAIDFYVSRGLEDKIFYAYKFNSVMFQDSNFVAILVLSLLFFSLYLIEVRRQKVLFFSSLLLFALLVLTLSRAAILSSVIFLIIFRYRALFYKYRVFLLALFLLSAPLFFELVSGLAYLDSSFLSRFYIIDQAFQYAGSASLGQLLIGVGFGNSVTAINMGSHNFFVTLFVESGLIGLLSVLCFWLFILTKSHFKAGIVMFPFLLAGMSFASLAMPFLYAIYAIILRMEKKK